MWLGEIGVIGHHADTWREGDAGEVSLVRAGMREALRSVRRSRPQADRPLCIGEEDGQGGAPRTRPENSDLVGHAAEDSSGLVRFMMVVSGRGSGNSHQPLTVL